MNSPCADAHLVFDFADGRGRPRRVRFARPLKVVSARSVEEVRPALREVQKAVGEGFYAAGYLSYEAAPAFDAALAVRGGAKVPPLWFGIFREPAPADAPDSAGEFQVSGWRPSTDWRTYARAVADAREAIARGDTYQINYTLRLRARFRGDDFAFYRQLSARQGADYCAYLNTGRFRVLSASPELFFRWRGGKITTRPMKGTARRGRWLEEDEALCDWLARSEKNRAENVMIVDLLRNDLGRVAETGSVSVRDLCRVERYPTVLQLTSTVEALTRPGVTLEEVFAALFPCGSVTGAPKVSTMRLIAKLEDSPRNVYCGCVGFVAPGGEATFNVAIRTVLIDGETGEAEYGVGGGITWDSTAADEYKEALTKAALLSAEHPEFKLLETMLLEGNRFALLERHLQRLENSARYFDFNFNADDARRALDKLAASNPSGAHRVRLLAARDGDLSIECHPLEELPPGTQTIALSDVPVARSDIFLYHKTTHREVYELHRARHPSAFDVLLWNEDEELTEFTNGNLVVELGGQLWTPPRECGLLAGTMRAELLERGELKECVLTRAHLAEATRLWLINSVRGRVPVSLVG